MVDVEYLKDYMFDIIGAMYNVQNELGLGLNEYCYQEGLQIELIKQQIPFAREVVFHPKYNGEEMKAHIKVDFLCKRDVIVECKGVAELLPIHRAQLFSYMRIAECSCGILVNFGQPGKLYIERYFYDKFSKEILTVDGYPIHKERNIIELR